MTIGSTVISAAVKAVTPYALVAKLGAVAAVAAAIFGSGYHLAYKNGAAELATFASTAQSKYDSLLASYNEAISKANATAQGNTTVLAAGVGVLTNNLNKENENAKQLPVKPLVFRADSSSNSGVYPEPAKDQNGQYRTVGVQSNSNPSLATGTGDQEVCRLDDATGKALHAITQDGDAAIRQLNAVIDAYNLVQKVGCSVRPATREEIGSLLDGTPFEVKDVEVPNVTMEKIKDGVFTIAPYVFKSIIPLL